MPTFPRRLAVTAFSLALLGAACGDDDDSADTTSAASETAAPTTAAADTTAAGTDTTAAGSDTTAAGSDTTAGATGGVEGCGPEAVTDPADNSAGRAPARCEPGAPAPQPLPERQTVRLTTGFRAEFVAPVLLGISQGEFDKENIDVEIQELSFSDALPLMASGDVDVAIGGTEAALFNAIDSGIGAKWALANYFPPSAGDNTVPQTGLWARRDTFSDPDNPDLAELEGKALASAVGAGSVIAYPIEDALESAGLTLTDLSVQQIPSTDMVLALENNAVQAAWLLDPYWIQASQNPDLVLVASQPPGEPLGGLYFGPDFLGERRDVASAFTRAYIRTINTYLAGDYQTDEAVMAALSEATGTSVEDLRLTPSLTFDWEIREGTTDRTQAVFIANGSVSFSEPIPEAEAVDRSLYLEAVGGA